MLERLKKVIKENVPTADVSNVTGNTRLLEDLGIDSIGLLMLSMSIEDEFGVAFDEPVQFVIVQDVIDYLEKNATK